MISKTATLLIWVVGLVAMTFSLSLCTLYAAVFGPSKWDVLSALSAFEDGVAASNSGTATTGTSSVTWANSDGSAAFEYTIPTGSPPSFPGQYAFQGYKSGRSNYVVNGTLSISLNNPYYGSVGGIYKVADLVTTGTLSLSGGSISSMQFNITSSLYAASTGSSTQVSTSDYGGSVSVDGTSFDISRLFD